MKNKSKQVYKLSEELPTKRNLINPPFQGGGGGWRAGINYLLTNQENGNSKEKTYKLQIQS